MADINVIFKTAVKEIAASPGKSATFMAKPHFDDAGSSCHIHSSLWDADGATSLMAGDGEHHMSDLFRWYLGGQMATAAEFALLVAPTVNSYRRFLPGELGADRHRVGASTTARSGSAWSATVRGCGWRTASPAPTPTPYHAFAATLAGGLYGIANRIEPPAPYDGDGYTATDLARIPSIVRRGDRAVARQHDRPRVLRRRRPPPRAALRRDRARRVRRHGHRLGAPPLLRTHLTPPAATPESEDFHKHFRAFLHDFAYRNQR